LILVMEGRESGEPQKYLIGRLRPRLVSDSEMGFNELKNPITLIGLVLPRLDSPGSWWIAMRECKTKTIYNEQETHEHGEYVVCSKSAYK